MFVKIQLSVNSYTKKFLKSEFSSMQADEKTLYLWQDFTENVIYLDKLPGHFNGTIKKFD